MKIIPAIIGSVSTLAVCAGAGVGIGMATNENFKNDVYTTIGVVSEQKYEETQTQLQEELEKIAELQSDKVELENEIATIKNEKDDIASSLLTKESELETLTNTYNELVESNNAATAQLETLASEIETKKSEIATLQAQYDECSAHLSGAYADISALNNQIASLQSQLENLQNVSVTLENGQITYMKQGISLTLPTSEYSTDSFDTSLEYDFNGSGFKSSFSYCIENQSIWNVYVSSHYNVLIGNNNTELSFIDKNYQVLFSDAVVSVNLVDAGNNTVNVNDLLDDTRYRFTIDVQMETDNDALTSLVVNFVLSENV